MQTFALKLNFLNFMSTFQLEVLEYYKIKIVGLMGGKILSDRVR